MKDHSYYKTRRRLRREGAWTREPEPFFQTQQMLKDALHKMINEFDEIRMYVSVVLADSRKGTKEENLIINKIILDKIAKMTLFLKKCAENP